MAETLLQTPYSTAMPYIVKQPAGGFADEYDNQRLLSYDLYDDLYNNDPAQFRMMLRGTNEKPIYVPTAKKVVNALARYVGKNWGFKVLSVSANPDPLATEVATPEQIADAEHTYGTLFARERMLQLFRAGLPEWLRRGDWCWMLSADINKVEGRRISVKPIDPRRYFPVNGDPNDVGRVTGQQIIEQIMIGETAGVLVQTWLKYTDPAHPDYQDVGSTTPVPEEGYDITYEVQAYDLADYTDPAKRKKLGHPGNIAFDYLPGIKTLPIYHIRNNETTDDPFGRSDLSGLESMMAGINQAVSDEDLSLAMMGLGMYWTNSGAPVDEKTGRPTGWKLGPKRVIEVDEDSTFEKVEGITSVQPFQDHVNFMQQEAQSTNGLSDVSVGTAQDVSAESGIALAIRFSPTTDTVKGKNEAINSTFSQMFFDLKTWFAVYEGKDFGPVEIISECDDDNLMPFDREARWKELMEGVTAGVFTKPYAIEVLEKEFGYVFPEGYIAEVEAAAVASAAALDPFAARADAEAAADIPTE